MSTATRIDMSILIEEPANEYHKKAKEYLSSHQLADFQKCPLLYHRKRNGLIVEEDRPAYVIGRAAHTLILEGMARFKEEYIVGGPLNKKTGKPFGKSTKAYADWAKRMPKPVLTHEQVNLLQNMAIGVSLHKGAEKILSSGVAERVVRTEYCGMPCQIRMDWFDPHYGITDLKTCDDLTWFESDARRWKYAHQLAFYRGVLEAAMGETVPVHLIAVEKKQAYRCGVWHLEPEVLRAAQYENEAAIARLQECIETNTWPTGYEETRVFDHI